MYLLTGKRWQDGLVQELYCSRTSTLLPDDESRPAAAVASYYPGRCRCAYLKTLFHDATRISKNSSRFVHEMHRKRSRSRIGTAGSRAWSSTRQLNSSRLSSRLMYWSAGGRTGASTGHPLVRAGGGSDSISISQPQAQCLLTGKYAAQYRCLRCAGYRR